MGRARQPPVRKGELVNPWKIIGWALVIFFTAVIIISGTMIYAAVHTTNEAIHAIESHGVGTPNNMAPCHIPGEQVDGLPDCYDPDSRVPDPPTCYAPDSMPVYTGEPMCNGRNG